MGKKKQRAVPVLALLVCTLCLMWPLFRLQIAAWKENKLHKEQQLQELYTVRYPQQAGVSREDCAALLERYSDAFETVASVLRDADKLPYGIGFWLDDERQLQASQGGRSLLEDPSFAAALAKICADPLFETNPLTISASTVNEVFYLDICMYRSESYRETFQEIKVYALVVIGMAYRENGLPEEREGLAERLDEHWNWYEYGYV